MTAPQTCKMLRFFKSDRPFRLFMLHKVPLFPIMKV